MKDKVACFTGHRSQKLPWGFNEEDGRCQKMKERLRIEIVKAIENGYRTFLCGMAIGFDLLCAQTVLSLKEEYPNIRIIGALPCRTQDCKWSNKEKLRYRYVLGRLDGVRCIYGEYISGCMVERNRYMVNSSSLIIALFNGKSGGTKSTIDFARRQCLDIVIIEP